ncbi:putative leucine carboxyl methyltransferase superfamily [Diplodia seriata]|uniref:Leucine carboxyl methyltransferase 1 n=1 Tax=Diplodia seriata TaxID=420778 RepID=A0A0G2GTD1_9PEZI|nr:putative leucine carboxyl methyltransferase superfamily [Diplodia seriata]OMP81577.1 Leucine carboxyl methyltransferase 1 [Diplodia seriata]
MSAPQIPNLLDSLRSGRGGSRGRGRGPRHGPAGRGAHSAESQDSIVQQTDGDALGSRVSAVDAGFLRDPFIKDFVTEEVQSRFPIINRGTYVRTVAIDRLVDHFLDTEPDQPKQVVSLGAGSDTRVFRTLSTRASVPLIYHEIDFPANTRKKIAAIKRTPTLLSVITSHLPNPADLHISEDLTSLYSPIYNIHPLDLRSLALSSSVADSPTALPELSNLSPTTPTLILSECCLIYLAPDDADSIVANLVSSRIPAPTPVSLVLYEPIEPDDAFGQMMISNLSRRGIVLQTLKKYSSLLRQRERLKRYGFTSGQAAVEVKFVWEKWLKKADPNSKGGSPARDLDEEEEWNLLSAHYCVAWGWRDGEGDLFSTAWKQLETQGTNPQ